MLCISLFLSQIKNRSSKQIRFAVHFKRNKTMKKIFFAAAILLSAVAFYSCKDKSSAAAGAEDPKVVLANFFDALSKADIEAAKKLSTTESQAFLNMAGAKISENKEMLAKYDKSKMTFGEATITGDDAVVPITTNNTSANFPLKKVDGQWKVDINFNSMMSLNMDKIKERQGIRGLDKLKNMNVDSLAKEMIRKNDSAKAALEKMK
jgi:hypothetical protein